jgi:hypothetical protein
LNRLLELVERHSGIYLLALAALFIAGLIKLPGWMLEEPAEGVPAMIGFVFGLAALLGLPFAALDLRSVDRSIEEGETLAEWHYTDEDRRRCAGISLLPPGGGVLPGTWVIILLVAAFSVALSAASGFLIAGVTLAGGIILLAGVVSLPLYAKERRQHALRAASLRAVRITPDGLKVDGEYLPVNSSGLVLRDAALLAGTPAILTFTSRRYRLQKIGSSMVAVAIGGKRVLRLPVPAGREDEAAAVVQRLKDELPELDLRGE